MPDKKTEWMPDDAFWNDAWADMDQRLDRKRRRRVLLPWLLGLALFLGAGALGIYVSQTANDSGLPPAPFAAENALPDPASDVPDFESEASQPADTRHYEVDRSAGPVATTEEARGRTPASRSTVKQNRTSVSVGDGPPQNAQAPAPEKNTSPAPRPPAPPNGYRSAIVEALPLASFLLETVPQLELPPVNTPEEAPSFTAKPVFGPYVAAVGATGYVNSYLPGGYLQVGREFGQGGWFLPVALRYDYSRREISVGRVEDLAEALNLTQADISGNFSTALGSRLGQDGNNLIETHTLALRGGIGRRFSPRLSLAVGGGLNYLLAGKGPLIVNSGNGNYYALRVAEERLQFADLSGGNAYRSAYYQNDQVISDDINRITGSLWLSTQYRIAARWGLHLGLTQELTPFYRTDAFHVETTRIEFGVLGRF